MLVAGLILIGIATAVPAIFSTILYKKKDNLHEEKTVKTFGTMYMGRRV